MKPPKLTIENVVYGIFLTISFFFIGFMTWGSVSNPFFNVFQVVIFIVIDYGVEYYIIGTAKWYSKNGHFPKAFFSWLLVVLYLVVFYLPSGASYIMMQTDVRNKESSKADFIEQQMKEDINTYTRNVATYTDAMEKENVTGFKGRAESRKEDKEEAQRKKEALLAEFKKTNSTSTNNFQTLEDKTGIPANLLQLVMTITAVFFVSIFIILTAPEVTPIHYRGITTSNEDDKTSEEVNTEVTKTSKEVAIPPISLSQTTNDNFMTFAENFLRETKGCNSTEKVAKETGIPWRTCLDYRDRLRNAGLITLVPGACTSLQPKEFIMDKIRKGEV